MRMPSLTVFIAAAMLCGLAGSATAGVHKMPMREHVAADAPKSNAASAHLVYYGGPVIANVKVVQVLYGAGTYASQVSGSQMGSFYSQVTNSSFIDMLAEYSTAGVTAANGSVGSNQVIGHGSFAGQVQITPSAANDGSSIDDTAIQAELTAQINAGHLPVPDANTLYMINFPKGKTITQGGTGSCVSGGFCAYHGTAVRSGADFFYGVLPDMSSGSGCDLGCGSDASPFNNQTSVASHEFSEAITDAAVGLATTNGPPLAWYDQTNGEIGDICNAQQGSFTGSDGVTYVVQKEWSNASFACIDHAPAAPGGYDAAITAPGSGATVSGTLSVTAKAGTQATKIEIYLDGSLLGTGYASPYTLSWNSTTVADGAHSFTAKGYNSAGASTTSAAVSVTVNNSSGGGNCPSGTTDIGGVCVPTGGGGGGGCSSTALGGLTWLAGAIAAAFVLRRARRQQA